MKGGKESKIAILSAINRIEPGNYSGIRRAIVEGAQYFRNETLKVSKVKIRGGGGVEANDEIIRIG
jgi:hypothetical protein